MEAARASADARDSRFEGLQAEASAAVAYCANTLRMARDQYRSAYAELHGRRAEGGSQLADMLATHQAMLTRLEVAEQTLANVWLFLEHGDASLTGPDVQTTPHDVAMRVVEAQEAERSRLAQEIHDGPAQALTNAIFQVDYIERIGASDPTTAAAELRDLRDLLRRELGNVRDFINQLRPPLLDELGLDGAINEAVEHLRTLSSLSITTSLTAAVDTLDDAQRTTALRVTQEALQNVRKHAEASTVVVETTVVDSDWNLEVRDDGRGFDAVTALVRGRRNFGLQFMRERAEMIGARLDIRSQPGDGTVVRLSIPMAAAGAEENT
jgi:two-component system sensor histidine kinase DegS